MSGDEDMLVQSTGFQKRNVTLTITSKEDVGVILKCMNSTKRLMLVCVHFKNHEKVSSLQKKKKKYVEEGALLNECVTSQGSVFQPSL